MNIKDIKSHTTTVNSNIITFQPNSTEWTIGVDTKNYNYGLMFFMLPFATENENNTISFEALEESDDDSTWNDTYIRQYIGDVSLLQNLNATVGPNIVPTIGVFGNKRYLRVRVSSGATNSGTITSQFIWILRANLIPDSEDIENGIIYDFLVGPDGKNILTNDNDPILVIKN